MAYSATNMEINEKCSWCGEVIENFADNRTRIKRIKACRYGKCSSYLAFYENNIRQLHAYMKSMTESDRVEATNLLLAFAFTKLHYSSVKLGKSRPKIIKLVISQV